MLLTATRYKAVPFGWGALPLAKIIKEKIKTTAADFVTAAYSGR